MGEELGRACRVQQHVECVRAECARLGRAEDRLRLAFDTDVHDDRTGERDDGEGDGERREDDEGTAKHESSFREGFGVRGERQVF